MIPETVLANLQSWVIQVFVIASIGMALPWILRIRHPRSQLIFCHLLLASCLILPLLQPWQHPVVVLKQPALAAASLPAVAGNAAGVVVGSSWRQVAVWILVAGIVARLSWTISGLWMIRRRRASATPLYPIPDSIKEAGLRTNTRAVFCLSSDGAGPVTFGLFRPIVLVPASFMSLSAEAQCVIACHELLHVRRRDWLVTVVEEVIAGLFTFWMQNPDRLPETYREQMRDESQPRVICDYIAGMTDNFVLEQHRQLIGGTD